MEAGAKEGRLVGGGRALHAGRRQPLFVRLLHTPGIWMHLAHRPQLSLPAPATRPQRLLAGSASSAPRRPSTPPAAMSKRGSSHGPPPTRPDYTAAEPAGPPPPSPLDEAARAAAAAPNPIPQPATSKGALEGSTSWVPAPLQPAAMLAVGEWANLAVGAAGGGLLSLESCRLTTGSLSLVPVQHPEQHACY